MPVEFEKIAEGTYRARDVIGTPINPPRLDAMTNKQLRKLAEACRAELLKRHIYRESDAV